MSCPLTMRTHEWIMARAQEVMDRGETDPRLGRDPVNQATINTWLDAIGDDNPVYRDTPEAWSLHGGPVAPTAMSQVWTMHGLRPQRPAFDPLHNMMEVFDEAGFTSVLGTNCDQTYERYLRPGEQVSVRTRLESVVGPKQTGVGEGYFVTTLSTWYVGDEPVATMLFRVLKFRPKHAVVEVRAERASKPPEELVSRRPPSSASSTTPSQPIRPMVNRDTEFFWQGTASGELRIQKCDACGLLRHPPGPMCPSCHETKRSYVVASGRGTVFSYVVHHAPQIPGKELPLTLGLIELEEGVRMVGELKGPAAIGDPVEVVFDTVDDDLTLVAWRPL